MHSTMVGKQCLCELAGGRSNIRSLELSSTDAQRITILGLTEMEFEPPQREFPGKSKQNRVQNCHLAAKRT